MGGRPLAAHCSICTTISELLLGNGVAAARVCSAAQRMRTARPAAQLRRSFADRARAYPSLRLSRFVELEAEAHAPAIVLRSFRVLKAKLDLRERITSAGPPGQGVRPRRPALGKSQPPSHHGPPRLIDGIGHRLDDRQRFVWQSTGVAPSGVVIIVGGPCPGLAREALCLGLGPGTEVPGPPVMRPCH